MAFDLPNQLGFDPDDERAYGEVGRVGVSIATVDDMRTLFGGIDLAEVTTSMTINAPAAMLLALYTLEAERQGATAVQEIAFTLANAMAYVRGAQGAGLDPAAFMPRLSFFFACHGDLLEEVAKFRAARRLWARIVRDRFGVDDARAQALRFHTQTGGSTLTAQQPLVDVVRTAYEALAAVLGGTQSLHTNGFDEVLGLPTEAVATLALRMQQVLAFETGVAEAIGLLSGSFYVEHLTDELEREAGAAQRPGGGAEARAAARDLPLGA